MNRANTMTKKLAGAAAGDRRAEPGAATPELRVKAHQWWAESAAQAGVDLTGFQPEASLDARLAWAAAAGLVIGIGYSRFSGKKQHSTEDQIRTDVQHACRNRVYCPPEFLCVDEAQKGRKELRDGLERVKRLLSEGRATVLIVFKLSRLYRKMHKSVKFIEEELVEEGLRAISATQAIDTADRKTWRLLVALHGTMDEELLVAIADHVRESQVTLMENGWATGALAVGYRPKEIPGAPKTRRGLPRTGPAVDPAAAELIRQHFTWIADEVIDLYEGWRRWREAGGPVDPRSSTGRMSYPAYRRMLERVEYTGLWPFGRKRNSWSSKKDTLEQKVQPPEEVRYFRCEELRIVDDLTFCRVQERLKKLKHANPRGKRRKEGRVVPLEDRVVHLFKCGACGHRFHVAGAHGRAMRCPNVDCGSKVVVNRREAVRAVCEGLGDLARADAGLVDLIVAAFANPEVLAAPQDSRTEVEELERRLRAVKDRVNDLEELLGTGSDEDRERRKNQLKAADLEKSGIQTRLAGLRAGRSRGHRSAKIPTRAEVMADLADLSGLLLDAAAGELDGDLSQRAASILERLVGTGGIRVVATPRPGRTRFAVLGRLTPDLLSVVAPDEGNPAAGAVKRQLEVFLRPVPLVDRLADEVRHLYDVEGINYPEISSRLSLKHKRKIGTGVCASAYQRWYASRGSPVPPRRTTEGRPRRTA